MSRADIEAAFAPPPPSFHGRADLDHGIWTALLQTHLRQAGAPPARFAYRAFTPDDRGLLQAYLQTLQRSGVAGLGRAAQFAFWINLYNAQTVAVVLDHYPVASIRDIALGGGVRAALLGGPWQKTLMTVAGVRLSLDEIENNILRRLFRDPRLHYALNCASMGCPSLGDTAFTGEMLEVQLEAAARDFINAPHGVRFEGSRLVLSSIFDWYRKDFGGTDRALLDHLAGHADDALRQRLLTATRIDGYQYDWRLNDA